MARCAGALDETIGADPAAELTFGPDGALHGTCNGLFLIGGGGDVGVGFPFGTVFRAITNGTITVLLSFPPNGLNPRGSLTFGADASIHGTCAQGGTAGGGNVFRLAAWSFFSQPVVTNGTFQKLLTGQPGTTYTIESASSLTGSWQKRTDVTPPTTDQGLGGGTLLFSEPALATTNRYYRTRCPAY